MKRFFLPEPQIIAIGGGIPQLPPESFEAVTEGFKLGADAVYLCVRFTKDLEAVVSQTESINTNSGEVKISETDYETLAKLDAAWGFSSDGGNTFPFRGMKIKIRKAEEYLAEFTNQKFCMDIAVKSQGGVKRLCGAINRLNASGRIMFFSYHYRNIKTASELCPESAFSFTITGAVAFYGLFKSGFLFFRKKFKPEAMIIPEFIGPSYIASQGFIKAANIRGIRVYIYGAAGEDQIKRLRDAGVNGYVTRDMKSLIKII